jgi:hypothetical protein
MPVQYKPEVSAGRPQAAQRGSFAHIRGAPDVRATFAGQTKSFNLGELSRSVAGNRFVLPDVKAAAAIQTAASIMGHDNPIGQIVSVGNLAAAFAPTMFGSFVTSAMGRTVMAGLQAFGVGDIMGRLTGSTFGGSALGAGIGALLGGPIGFVAGLAGGLFGGRSAERRKRETRNRLAAALGEQEAALREQTAAIGEQREAWREQEAHLDIGLSELGASREGIQAQFAAAQRQAVLNYAKLKADEEEAGRVKDINDFAVKRITTGLVGQQRVAFATTGFLSRGSSWLVLGETANMGERKLQELNAEYKGVMSQINYQRQDLASRLDAARRESEYASYQLGLSERALILATRTNRRAIKHNVRTIQSNIAGIGRNVRQLEDYGSDYLDRDRLARARALVDFGSAVGSGALNDIYRPGSILGKYQSW